MRDIEHLKQVEEILFRVFIAYLPEKCAEKISSSSRWRQSLLPRILSLSRVSSEYWIGLSQNKNLADFLFLGIDYAKLMLIIHENKNFRFKVKNYK